MTLGTAAALHADTQNRRMNEVGLWMLLAPSGLYAGIPSSTPS